MIMISRYKWYQVRLPCSVAELFTKLRDIGYDNASTKGFLINESESSFRYIWPSTINAVRLDNDGNYEYQQVATVNSQSVTVLSQRTIILRFESPVRSMREVFNALESAIGFGFSCEQIVINDSLVQAALVSATSKTLNTLKVSGAIPSANSLARIELASKEGINTEKVKLLGLADFLVEAASYEVLYKGLKGHIGFSRSAACKISGPLTPFILSSLESALQEKY